MKPALLLIPILAILALVLLRQPDSRPQGSPLAPAAPAAGAEPAGESADETELSGEELVAGTNSANVRDLAPAAASQPAAAEAGPAGPIGRVVSTTGAPLGGAELQLQNDSSSGMLFFGPQDADGSVSTSAADGTFQLPPVKRGVDQEVVVRLAGYTVLKVPADGDDLGDLVLEPGVVVRGTVLDFHGDPVADARVVRTNAEDSPQMAAVFLDASHDTAVGDRLFGDHGTRTDDQGRFELPYEAAGELELTVSHEEHPRHVHIAASQVGDTLDETLMLPESARIAGILEGLDSSDSSGIEVLARARDTGKESSRGALIRLGNGAERRADVEPDGTFVLPGLKAGATYTVWAGQSSHGNFRSDPCSAEVVAVAGDENVQLSYRGGSTLRFTVVDAKTGEAIPELKVDHSWVTGGRGGIQIPSSRKRTYRGGEVEITPLRPSNPPAVLKVSVSASGFRSVELTPSIPAEGEVNLGQVQLTPTATLAVRVESADGQPIEGAKVAISSPSGGALGGFRSASSPGGEVRSISVTYSSGSSGGGGSSVQNIDELLNGLSESVKGTTDENGVCELALPDLKTATLTVAAKGYAISSEADLPLPRSGSAEHAVVLTAGGRVELTVVTSDGNPAPDVSVEHDGERRKFTSDSQGRIVLENLRPGQHHFRLAKKETPGMVFLAVSDSDSGSGDDMRDWTPVLVSEGETARATLTQKPVGSLSGTVTSQGEAVRSARLKLLPVEEDLSPRERALRGAMDNIGGLGLGGGGPLSDKSGRKGDYAIEDVEVGLYTLRVTHKDWAMPQEFEVRVGEGVNQLDVDLSMCILAGRILNKQGEPIAGAEVSVTENSDVPTRFRVGFSVNGTGGVSAPGAVLSDSNGRYELRGVRQDVDLSLEAKADGMAPTVLETSAMYTDERRSGVDVVLERGAQLTVVLEESTPPDARVMARPANGQPLMQQASGGRVVFDGMSAGEWTVSILAMGGDENSVSPETVTLAAEEVRTIVLDGLEDE